MNLSVNEAFDVFDQRIRLTDDALKFALDEASAISRLISTNPAIKSCIITGSLVRSTAIKEFSDVDIIAILDDIYKSDALTPAKAMSLVAHVAGRHMHQITDSGNSISGLSENGIKVDVLPAIIAHADQGGNEVYQIPAATRSAWQKYSPDAQTQGIAEIDMRVGPRFKQLIRAIKWWSGMNGKPVRSHEIEVLASRAFDAGIPELPQAVVVFFDFAIEDLHDSSRGMEPVVCNSNLHSSVKVALSKLHSAGDLAKHARKVEMAAPSNAPQAIHLWRGLFGEQFPDVLA